MSRAPSDSPAPSAAQTMTDRQPSAWAEIDLSAIAHNVRALKNALAPQTQLMAVVKADAYGHGAVPVARTTLQHGATWLGVARVGEALDLRAAGIDAPILLLGPMSPAEAADAVRARLRVAIASLHVARALAQQSTSAGVITPVHLKVDTGMSRFGVPLEAVVDSARALLAMPGLRLEGIFTHFAAADDSDKTFTRAQSERFAGALAALEGAGIRVPLRHAANSAGVLSSARYHFDLVRPGIALYGAEVGDNLPLATALRPALSLKSRVAYVRHVPAGTTVGYGRTFTCERPMRLALVSIGYADGVRRALSNKGAVLIRGRRAPIAGRVSMDQIVVSAEECNAQEGDEVVLIGRQSGAAISVDEVAAWADTIAHEIFTGISARVPRLYLGG